ncbi:hypothetical protein Dred_0849 [Desulforamulus reducens MI-1]|uniref:Uncharacterized protein n=1 Tax=Desulforamulus reducens (strain ATCC BAA-1160 / DSM 100696 / MI-1) TaxID=349161 RepID=A4J2T4_DESRM|nr:hypothetical protein [Desulforamulus reducens]ABO49387.1 hypothetical protein Dred_0849 [Desulforamulus reducens MI-1]
MFNKLAEKVMGKGIEECVLRVHATRNKLYELIDKVKVREAQINNTANKDKDQVFQKIQKEINDVRVQYAVAKASLEKAKADQAGLISLVGLLTVSMQAGRDTKELESVISMAICGNPNELVCQEERKEKSEAAGSQGKENGMESGVFNILEIRDSSPGTIRAWCDGEDGSKSAIFVKNGMRQKVIQAQELGKKIFVKYRQGDKGLIAYGVDIVG